MVHMKPFPYQLRVAQHLVANKRVMLDADSVVEVEYSRIATGDRER